MTIIWILVILIFLTIPLVIILISLAFSDNKSKKSKVEYLKKEGKIIEAERTDFKSYTASMSIAVYVRIVARSFVHGKPQEFKSERIYPNKCKLEVGDKVKILVNMKNPKQYYFDPYQKEY